MAKRTYTTGISFAHFPKNKRKRARHRLATIVEELSNESMEFCSTYIDDVLQYFLGEVNPRITDNIEIIDSESGKFGINAIMTQLNEKYQSDDGKSANIAANHLHSAMHLLSGSTKGHYNRITKLIEVLSWLDQHPEEMMHYLLWGRSTYLNNVFAKYWKTTFNWVDNLMFGVWKRFFSKHTLPEILPKVSPLDFLPHLDRLIVDVSAEEETPRRKSFIKRLHFIKNNVTKLDLSSIPSGWKESKQWIAEQQLPKYKTSAWAAVVRSVISRVYVSENKFDTLIRTLRTAHVSDLLNTPFKNKLKKLPYLMVSGPKYVVRRKNNKQSLEEMRNKGYFSLTFKELRSPRWKDALTVRVRASRKMREIIKYERVKLRSMIILPPKGPARDVDVRLIFEGPREVFIATKHLKKIQKVNKREQIGIDVNRRGKYAVVSSFNTDIPQEIDILNQRWTKVLAEIQYLQSLMDKGIKPMIYEQILELLFQRKINLRREYHLLLVNFVGQQMVSADAQTLVTEGLQVSTRGKKAALAKAIESMPDGIGLYAREVFAVSLYTGRDCNLHTENPFGSSKFHVGCGGVLQRDKYNYDIVPCKKCGKMVNTHHNAALYIEAKYLGFKPTEKNCLKQLKIPIGS